MSVLLAKTRAAFGPAPRTIRTWDHVVPPSWMSHDDPLRKSFDRARDLMVHGDIVWGHIVQANTLLFSPGDADCPADVLFGSNPSDDLSPQRLQAAASAAMALKGTRPVDEGLHRVAAALTDEMSRHPGLDLPDALTRGAPMRMAVIMVHRVYLPLRYLAFSALPLVVSRARDAVMLLPVRHWDESLVRAWLDLGTG